MKTSEVVQKIAPRQQDEIRRRVRQTLERTGSFNRMPKEDQDVIATNMVKTMSFLVEAGASPAMLPLARAQADEGVGAAARAGASVMAKLVKDVDFPKFVKGLIEGVFQSIVESTIHQMQEYGKFLESVVKSVEEFAQDHVDKEEARDYLVNKFPAALQKKTVDGKSTLAMRDDVDDKQMPDFKTLLGMAQPPDLESEGGDEALIIAAQVQMAKQRQQLLATMVLLGINRIVVTEGEIKASVMFDVKSTDTVSDAHEHVADTSTTSSEYAYAYSRNRSFWGTSNGGSGSGSSKTTVSTDHASDTSASDSKLETKAKLTGNVLVKFKSETFPLERMASPMELAGVQQKSQK